MSSSGERAQRRRRTALGAPGLLQGACTPPTRTKLPARTHLDSCSVLAQHPQIGGSRLRLYNALHAFGRSRSLEGHRVSTHAHAAPPRTLAGPLCARTTRGSQTLRLRAECRSIPCFLLASCGMAAILSTQASAASGYRRSTSVICGGRQEWGRRQGWQHAGGKQARNQCALAGDMEQRVGTSRQPLGTLRSPLPSSTRPPPTWMSVSAVT